jgi:hypothetical protein
VGFVASIVFAAKPGFGVNGPDASATFAPAPAIDASSPTRSVPPTPIAVIRIRDRISASQALRFEPSGPSSLQTGGAQARVTPAERFFDGRETART